MGCLWQGKTCLAALSNSWKCSLKAVPPVRFTAASGRSAHNDLHGFPGAAPYDSQYVQDCRRTAPRRIPSGSPYDCNELLNIFGDHSDVMACRQTGFAMMACAGVQEVLDLSAVCHLSAIRGRVPFLNFFDGFRTSHEIQKVELLDYDDLKNWWTRTPCSLPCRESMNPDTPVIRGTPKNPDIYFQTREAVNQFYKALPEVVDGYMKEISKLTGRDYQLFNYTGAPDAERVIILMGSGAQTAEEVVKILAGQGEKVGVLNVHLYRPFSVKHFLSALPETVKKIAVLDRTKEPGSDGEPLYLDVRNAFYESDRRPVIVGGRYGMGSKEFYPGDVLAVFDNLKLDAPKNPLYGGHRR